jgi:2-polyprenyl-3-methyl-5-hydroxy-6-metoxy-1,4-benzoquinol methylase
MDGPDVPAAERARCLADLATVNALTLARRPTLAFLARALADVTPGGRFTLLDVGFGQGDLLRAIAAWARRRGLQADLIGIDLHPGSAAAARAATRPGLDIEYLTADVFAFEPDRPIDLIVSSLFAHHLDDEAVPAFLGFMERTARRGWFVNDLHRHALAYHGFRALARVARWRPIVRHDGAVSVARSFRHADWERAVRAASLDPAAVDIDRRFPFRLCVGRLR